MRLQASRPSQLAQAVVHVQRVCQPRVERCWLGLRAGKTAKMYRGGKICLTIHFKPLWAKNQPHFGLAHALCLGLAPWLAAEVPHLVDTGASPHSAQPTAGDDPLAPMELSFMSAVVCHLLALALTLAFAQSARAFSPSHP